MQMCNSIATIYEEHIVFYESDEYPKNCNMDQKEVNIPTVH